MFPTQSVTKIKNPFENSKPSKILKFTKLMASPGSLFVSNECCQFRGVKSNPSSADILSDISKNQCDTRHSSSNHGLTAYVEKGQLLERMLIFVQRSNYAKHIRGHADLQPNSP